MTCIAAILKDGKVYMAADTMGSDDTIGRSYQEKKIIKKNRFLFGVCGCYKVINVLTYDFNPPAQADDEDDRRYIHRVAKAMSRVLGLSDTCVTSEGQPHLDSDVLIGYNGNIYLYGYNGQVITPNEDYICIGSGAYHAESSLYSTSKTRMRVRDRLKLAIDCASKYVMNVNNEVQIESV